MVKERVSLVSSLPICWECDLGPFITVSRCEVCGAGLQVALKVTASASADSHITGASHLTVLLLLLVFFLQKSFTSLTIT